MDIKNLKQIIEQELQAMVPDADDVQKARDLFTGTFEPIRLADIEDRTYSPDEVRQMGYETHGGITDSPFVKVKTKNPDGTEGVAYQLSKRSRDQRDYDLIGRNLEQAIATRQRQETPEPEVRQPRRGVDVDPKNTPPVVGGNISPPVQEIPVGKDPFRALNIGNKNESLQITLGMLRKLINEEIQRRELQEDQDERRDIPDVDDEKKLFIAQALDTLEKAAEDASDTDEVRWYLTKVGETFGLEPEETE